MIVAEKIVIKSHELATMMHDAALIYDQALYYFRQEYFKWRDAYKIDNDVEREKAILSLSKEKQLSWIDCYHLVKETESFKNSKIDCGIKQDAIKRAYTAYKSFLKACKEYKKNPSKFKGKPRMPKYIAKSKGFCAFTIDKTKFRKSKSGDRFIKSPNSTFEFRLPDYIVINVIYIFLLYHVLYNV